ncbi:hypothetical protein [Desulfoscipio gibsoniae]|uniref:Uncharacterized protein n=1 Tax=Desulfoscipio gibsoniae DSM 7213 TaxID=767817 RepID=R4KFN5_9FIRM|nr:hypothetical protein [Desulfoscipio gibsoniae]AGL01988.1 hypothetical protein Desgi_2582 [Desulfoscipio gibsoniae DSM 7213]
MRLFITKNGFCFSGKVSEFRQLIRPWSQTNVTLREFIASTLH